MLENAVRLVQLPYDFKNPELLLTAVTHKSFRNEQQNPQGSDNECLEFLGDAVLDLSLSELLMRYYPQDHEGSLSKKRASLVNEDSLAQIALELQIDQVLLLGKGERITGGLQKPRLLASAFEAVLGAIFRDSDYVSVHLVVEELFRSRIETLCTMPDFATDFKTRLQERSQEKCRVTPTYHVESESGPDHGKVFEVSVRLQDRVLATGMGRSKKAAEQEAASRALEQLND